MSRKIILNLRPDLFHLLPFDDDLTFLEPLMFSAFASSTPRVEMESIAIGYFCGDHDPYEFVVHSNHDRVVVIPNIGSRKMRQKKIKLLSGMQKGIRYINEAESININNLCFAPDPKTTIGDFTVYCQVHHLLYNLFKYTDETLGSISKNALVGIRYLSLLEGGLKQISAGYPEFFAALESVTRGFLVFRQPGMNSFASESAHGISFLSVPDYVSKPYFVDDIAHQCGHTVFSSVFFRYEELFDIAPDQPISQFTRRTEDNRSIYVVFHAVFTEHVIATCLLSCLGNSDCKEEEREEVLGRFAFIMKKYEMDLDNLEKVDARAENGELMYTELERSFNDLYSRSSKKILGANLAGQPYNFDFRKYKELN